MSIAFEHYLVARSHAQVTDMEDGSYEIQWKAPEITTELTIKIGGVHVPGSPFKVCSMVVFCV